MGPKFSAKRVGLMFPENRHSAFPTRVLLLEDGEADALELHRILKLEWPNTAVDVAIDREEFEERLWSSPPDLVIADYHFSGIDVWAALYRVKRAVPGVPFLVLSDSFGEEVAVELIKGGAGDVILKNQLNRLVPSIKRALAEREAAEGEKRAKILADRAIRAREEMLAVVSHDLKSPLSTILLLSEKSLAGAEAAGVLDPMETRRTFERIRRSASLMHNLILDVLDHARVEAGNFTIAKRKVCPKRVIEELDGIFAPLAREKKIRLTFESRLEEREGEFDPDKLFQAFSNLLSNAVKFTPNGGKLEVVATESEGALIFSVRDSGPGIPAHLKERIFDKFFQATDHRAKGAGLGLFIARRIAEGHGGKIQVESEVGAGTQFTIRIPFDSSEALDSIVRSAVRAGAQRKRILFIDDDDDFREVITEVLEREGHEVIPASDGENGLRLLLESTPEPHALIVDQSIPGMLGTDFIRQVRSLPDGRFNRIPVLLMSGEQNLVQIARDMDLKYYLKKPPSLLDLTKVVSSMSGEPLSMHGG